MTTDPPTDRATDSGTDLRGNRRHPVAQLLLVGCSVFILTIFLMVAAAFNPQAAGLARFFDRHGLPILAIEVGVILAISVILLAMERRETRRQLAEQEAALRLTLQHQEPDESLDSN